MTLLSRIARRFAGVETVSGRDLQLRAETLLLFSLITQSTSVFGDASPNILSRCADLVASDSGDVPTFENQASAVKSGLTAAVVRTLRATSTAIDQFNPGAVHDLERLTKEKLGFVPIVRRSSVPDAGLGLFVEGSAKAGSLLGLYPGTCYMPSDLMHLPDFPKITENNDYLIWRYDGIVIDGKDAIPDDGRLGEMEKEQITISGKETVSVENERLEDVTVKHDTTEPRVLIAHPFSLAHRINHPPLGKAANCLQFMLDVRLNRGTMDLRRLIPNELYTPAARSFFERLQNKAMQERVTSASEFTSNSVSSFTIPTLAIVATRDLTNEEVLMNYRYNPNGPVKPAWYHDCDPESSERRWKKTGVFL